jgi:hypothetical protein
VTGGAEFDFEGNLVRWPCRECGGAMIAVRHYLQRGGVMVHDPDAAMLEAAGLTEPEPPSVHANGASS